MRNIHFKVMMAVLAVGMLSACTPPDGDIEAQMQQSFMREYLLPSKPGTKDLTNINSFIRTYSSGGAMLEMLYGDEPGRVGFSFYHTNAIQYSKKHGQYRALAQRYGDLSYNDWVPVHSNKHEAVGEAVKGITVRCVNAFDDAHPALSSVNDILELEWSSYYDYIRQGYRVDESTRGNGWSGKSYMSEDPEWDGLLYHADLTDPTIFPINLMGSYFSIRFKKAPKENKTCTFRIEMELESGRQTSEFHVNWQ